MRAWLFQDTRQKQKLGDKCPWAVGWYDNEGKKKSKKIGARSTADKFKRKVEAELALGLCTVGKKRTTWGDFRKRFEEITEASKARGTFLEYQRSLEAYQRLMHPAYVDTITTADVDRFTAKRLDDRQLGADDDGELPELSPASVNKDLRALKVAFRKAYQWGMLPTPPVFTMLREPERDPYFIDDDAFKALYDACGSLARPEGRRYPKTGGVPCSASPT